MAESAVIAGYVLKVLREGVELTQAEAAERLGVDLSTVQGWESGRRPLGSLRASQLLGLRTRLTLLGCPARAADQLLAAVEADSIVSTALEAGDRPVPPELHPLAAVIHRRTLVNLITWPFSGLSPLVLRGLPKARRRGPVADRPLLTGAEQRRFFDHMQVMAELATGPEHSVLRRQAIYLLGFDRRPETVSWLLGRGRAVMRRAVDDLDLSSGIELRSTALALARYGDVEPLRYAIDHALSQERHALANLNYWAYWLGESSELHSRDEDVLEAPVSSWGGTKVMAHLIDRLDTPGHADLNIHSLWTLVRARRQLLADHPHLRKAAEQKLDQAEVIDLSARSRKELAKLSAAVELANH